LAHPLELRHGQRLLGRVAGRHGQERIDGAAKAVDRHRNS
jgi:hypothetical protein